MATQPQRERTGVGTKTVQVVGGAGEVNAFVRARLAALAAWAELRGMAPNSLAGISLLLAVCAATWFSAAKGPGTLVGVLAVFGWLLALSVGRKLAARAFAWPFAVATATGECIVYAGIAGGGQAAGWPGMWSLGTTTVVAVAVAETLYACGGVSWRLLAPSAGTRVLIAALMLALRGPRVALFSVLVVEAASVGVVAIRRCRLNHPGSADLARTCRNDGAVARWAGGLVRGNLRPLPIAIAGTAGAALLAALGLRGALGIISLAPVVVLLLAAPGSGHPHGGRFDWLVPAIMVLGQLIYLASLGFAWAVPGPAVFALCGLTVVWYAGLATGEPGGADHQGGLGWEGRLLIAGLAAIFGIATFGYVGLATYLAVLIGRRALAGTEGAVDRAGARSWGQQAAPPGD